MTNSPPGLGGNPESNTLISDMTTVICLDDYHSLDRNGRKKENVTALDPKAQNFDLMYEQIKGLKEGSNADKPIYNHVSGLLDPPETITPPSVRSAPPMARRRWQRLSKQNPVFYYFRFEEGDRVRFGQGKGWGGIPNPVMSLQSFRMLVGQLKLVSVGSHGQAC